MMTRMGGIIPTQKFHPQKYIIEMDEVISVAYDA